MANGITLKNPTVIGLWLKIAGTGIALLVAGVIAWQSVKSGVKKNHDWNERQEARITAVDNNHLEKLARLDKLGTATARENHEDIAVMKASQVRMERDVGKIIIKLDKALEHRP